MSTSQPKKPESKTPWIIGAFAIIVFAIATYMNFGGSLHLGAMTDVSSIRVANNVE
jgi:hypothetical protein